MDGFGMDIEEVTDREDEEESSHLKQSPKQPEPKRMRQVKLDTFLKCSGSMARPSSSTATSPSVVKVHSPRRSKSSFSVTTSIVPAAEVIGLADGKSALQRRSLLVVEEVDRDNLDSSIREQEIKRMSATIQKAKNRYDRTTLDSYVSRKETKFASLSQDESFTMDMEEEPDLEPLRCYSDQYPDLNDKQNTDIVLVSIGSIRPNVIPRPYPPACTDPTLGWNKGRNYVRLPFSTLNLHDDEMQFAKIQQHLLKLTTPLTSVDQIQECIESYIQRNWRFDALKKFFESAVPDELAKEYLSSVIPFIAKLALSAPDLITQPLPILRHGQEGSVTMSQQQAATLLAHAFFCTYPNRNGHSGGELPIINFNRLYDLRTRGSIEKLKCIMHYFHQISVQMPSGVLTYRRQRVSPPPIWREICQPLSEFVVSSSGTIEDDGHGMLQVDFANMFIGGGVLASGCVQEEIRFMICPEMIVSMLICERMRRNESIVIVGAQRYSDYAGYGNSFQWYPLHAPEALSRDRFERLHCELVAIDALPFSQPKHQFTVDLVDRELLKAYCGFRVRDGSSKAIATGNWGCGVFGGDLRLKSMIQLIAASMNARPLCYFTFGNRGFANQLRLIHKELVHMNINTNQLYDLVVLYCLEQSGQSMNLFEFIHQKLNNSV